MGCKLSKTCEDKETKNSNDDVLEEPPVPQPPDPRLPLTAKQKYNMVASWKGISRAMESTGILMFIKLFEEHQELLNLFEKFKKLKTKEEQASSTILAEHATIVMKSIDDCIKNLDNMDNFFIFVHQVGSSHRRIPGFKPEYFLKIEKPFLDAAKIILDDRFTENVENIYKITIKFVLQTLIDGFEQSSIELAVKSSEQNNNDDPQITVQK